MYVTAIGNLAGAQRRTRSQVGQLDSDTFHISSPLTPNVLANVYSVQRYENKELFNQGILLSILKKMKKDTDT